MATSPLVTQIRRLANDVAQMLAARGRPKISALEGRTKDAPDYLFELKVAYELLVGLKGRGWTIKLRPSLTRGGGLLFPRNPGKKENFSFFAVTKSTDEYQVVLGTQVYDCYDTPRAPDLSLQQSSAPPIHPTYQDLIAVWDAKLKGGDAGLRSTRVSDQQFRHFLKVLEWLLVPQPGTVARKLENFPVAFQVSALVTNGLGPNETKRLLLDEGVSVVAEFQTCDTPGAPTLSEHLIHPSIRTARP